VYDNTMPVRRQIIATGETYHVFNRGIDRRTTFFNKREHDRAMQIIRFYQFSNPPLKLSRFLSLPLEDRGKIVQEMEDRNEKLVEFYSFCLMPNHFHFLIKQIANNGISRFMSQFHNSYTRYFNTLHERVGPLFLDQFKAVHIETDEQLLHVSRYIHLNPYTSFVVKDFETLFSYPWSSLSEYFSQVEKGICNRDMIQSHFKDKEKYRKFIYDQANYQRELDKIKHLTLED
jgi:putative transposase